MGGGPAVYFARSGARAGDRLFGQPDFHRLASAELPRQPIFEVRPQRFQIDAETGFHRAVFEGERFIKGGASRKIPHAEAVQPGERTGPAPLGLEDFNSNLPREQRPLPLIGGHPSVDGLHAEAKPCLKLRAF